MSHYSQVAIEFTDEGCLLAALSRLGFAGKIEVHKEAQPLYGYQDDVRHQKAHVIIRRQFVGTAANDIGFEKQPNGSYLVWISEFDQSHNKYDDSWIGLLKQGYGIEKVRKEAKKKGFRLTEQKQDDGRVRLVLNRR